MVKANAYGLGIEEVVPALTAAGCTQFFVAQLQEALACRAKAPDSLIYCFNGYIETDAEIYRTHQIRPCLTSLAQVTQWQKFSSRQDTPLAAALYIDTGFNRLGLNDADLAEIAQNPALFDGWDLALIMSHLACGDRPDHPMNAAQREQFKSACAQLPKAPQSLANSAGILLGDAYHGDVVRCGIGLYGGAPADRNTAQNPVISVEGHILQLRDISAGDSVGYGADYIASHDQRIAIVAAGYADGYLRRAGRGTPPFAQAHIDGHPVPIIGRVSMDLLAIDITHLPDALAAKIAPAAEASSQPARDCPLVELIGPHSRIDDVAAAAGTISYELLTRIGNRYKRHYI